MQYEKKDYHRELTDKIIKSMEEFKNSGWTKPWFTAQSMPFNPVTGTRYAGVNVLSLMSSDFEDPRFVTYKNVQELAQDNPEAKIHVKKGAKGHPVFKAVQVTRKDQDGNDIKKSDGEPESFFVMAYAGTVFNMSQVNGVEPWIKRDQGFEPVKAIQELSEALKAKDNLKIQHSEEGRAYYSPMAHKVHMPNAELFKSEQGYYSTLLHELGHSTSKTLGRKITGDKSTDAYAKEELVAELTSYFMSAELGFEYDAKQHEQHAAYINSWISALKNDKNLIFKASSQASRATTFQLDKRHDYVVEKEWAEEIKRQNEKTRTLDSPRVMDNAIVNGFSNAGDLASAEINLRFAKQMAQITNRLANQEPSQDRLMRELRQAEKIWDYKHSPHDMT